MLHMAQVHKRTSDYDSEKCHHWIGCCGPPCFRFGASPGKSPAWRAKRRQSAARRAKSAPVDKEIRDLPDGVLKVKTNPDGSFKSLIVKATVEVEDVLGGQKGKRLARSEAEVRCKRLLSQWLKDNCAFAETQTKVTTIVTKGESSKDAAGNKVAIRNQKAEEIKANAEGYVSASTDRPERPNRAGVRGHG